MACFKRPVAPYTVPLDELEKDAYRRLRVQATQPEPELNAA